MAGKKGQKWSKPMTKQQRDEIAITKIEKMLDDHRDGICELSATQLKAIEIRYHKLRPALSAVEQTNLNPDDQKGDSDLLALVQRLAEQHPEILAGVMQAVTQGSNNAEIMPCASAQTDGKTLTH